MTPEWLGLSLITIGGALLCAVMYYTLRYIGEVQELLEARLDKIEAEVGRLILGPDANGNIKVRFREATQTLKPRKLDPDHD